MSRSSCCQQLHTGRPATTAARLARKGRESTTQARGLYVERRRRRAALTATSLALVFCLRRSGAIGSCSGSTPGAAMLARGTEDIAFAVASPSLPYAGVVGASRLSGGPARPVAACRSGATARRVWDIFGDTTWMQDPVVSIVGWTFLLSGLGVLRIATCTDDTDTPQSFLRTRGLEPAAGSGPKPVVCLGDSLTRCNLSADWVGVLRSELEDAGTAVINAGVNMQCAQNIQSRLCEVIACKPSHVTVLVGTNDLKAELSPVEGFIYRVFGKLPEAPTLENYEATLLEIRERLLDAGARVALVSPPVLGECASSEANQRAAAFAEVVRRIASEGGERCTYLPLFEKTSEALPPQGRGRPYNGMKFFAWLCLLCVDLYVLRRDLAEVQRERNLGVTVDLVHLGPVAAAQLAEMVADFVKEPVQRVQEFEHQFEQQLEMANFDRAVSV
mmetsp:Transcript_8015/g.16882  ORF Transcript_8015/g.16882 Transcript_8015/m.16882 type:complete len:446 (-) Transcript_8015:78-1415(-)